MPSGRSAKTAATHPVPTPNSPRTQTPASHRCAFVHPTLSASQFRSAGRSPAEPLVARPSHVERGGAYCPNTQSSFQPFWQSSPPPSAQEPHARTTTYNFLFEFKCATSCPPNSSTEQTFAETVQFVASRPFHLHLLRRKICQTSGGLFSSLPVTHLGVH